MDFIGHAAIGATLAGKVSAALKAPRWVIWVGITYGAVLGAWADVWPWFLSIAYGQPRWAGLYATYHFTPPLWILVNPPSLLHYLLDLLFHAAGGGWTSLGWVLEFVIWIALLAYWWKGYAEAISDIP